MIKEDKKVCSLYLVGFGGEGEARLEGRHRVQEAQHVLSSAETYPPLLKGQ